MKRIVPVVVALMLPWGAFAAKGDGGAEKWSKASDADRNALVQQVMMLNRGTYPPEKMRQCLDETFSASAPAAQRQSDFTTAAILCHAKLQPRK